MHSEISLKNISRLSSLFGKLGEINGCRFVWHSFAPNALFRTDGVEIFHSAAYCDKIKGHSIGNRCRCTDEHWCTARRISLERRKPFLHTCYAGVTDIVVPIIEDGVYCGDILIGSFMAAPVSPLGLYPAEYRELPHLTPALARHLPELVLELLELLPPHLPEAASGQLCPPLPPECDPRVHQALSFLRRRFTGPVDFGEIAREISLSPSRLRHLFYDVMGISMSEYLQRLRISHARSLVEVTELPMDFIAGKCGISDQARMAFLFRKYYAMSPSSCRRAERNSRSSIKNGR